MDEAIHQARDPQCDDGRGMKTITRKAYKAPKLKKYGDFRKLTLTKGTVNADGNGAAKTRGPVGGGA